MNDVTLVQDVYEYVSGRLWGGLIPTMEFLMWLLVLGLCIRWVWSAFYKEFA